MYRLNDFFERVQQRHANLNQNAALQPRTARITIFAPTTSTSVFACSRSATRLLEIVDQFVFADSSRGDQCVQLLARLAQSIQIGLLPFSGRRAYTPAAALFRDIWSWHMPTEASAICSRD
jgi:hypothetical protein